MPICRAHFIKQMREKSRQNQRGNSTSANSASEQDGHLSQDHPRNSAWLRTKRHANAEFARAQADRIRNYPVNTDGREKVETACRIVQLASA